ncbi:MAG: type II secretion system protein [Pararhodobacter sp.]|nr:type II secretion system protein [Pararhodobacter sp.]
MRPPLTTQPDHGMTLVELVLAIAILSIGMTAAWRSFEQAQRGIGGQVGRVLAQQVALNQAAELRLRGRSGASTQPAEARMGPFTWRIEVIDAETRGGLIEAAITVSAPGQPGARLVAYRPAFEATQ